MGARGVRRGGGSRRAVRRSLPPALFALGLALAFAVTAAGGGGELDTTWGGSGVVVTDLGDDENGEDVAVTADGKVVVAGYSHAGNSDRMFVLRYAADGTLDSSFGSGGKVVVDAGAGASSGAFAVAQRPDGGLVAVGWAGNGTFANATVVRISAAGTVEGVTTFDVGGEEDDASDVVVTSSAIFVSGTALHEDGSHELFAAKLTLAGTLDPTFAGDGIATVAPTDGRGAFGYALSVDPDGKVVVAGTFLDNASGDTAVVRLLANGAPDPGFGNGGVAIVDLTPNGFDTARSLVVATDGITVSSALESGVALVRFTNAGAVDTSWASSGVARIDHDVSEGLAAQSGGGYVLAGYEGSNMAVVRVAADGSLDTSFGADGVAAADAGGTSWAAGVALDADGNAVFAGSAFELNLDVAVARVTTQATVTSSSSSTSTSTTTATTTTAATTTAPPTSSTSTTTATTTVPPPPQPAPENHPPVASFVVTGTQAIGKLLTFDGGASTDFDGDPVTMQWSFGDGATGSGVVATHTYAAAGTYTVTLKVTDSHGAATQSIQTVVVLAQPPVVVTVSETATVTDALAVAPPAVLAVNEVAAVAASVSAVPPAVVSFGDTASVTATATAAPPAVVAASDSATVAATATARNDSPVKRR